MNIQSLKNREIAFLSSNKSRFREYGIAYKDILKMCLKYADDKVSEDVLISDMATEYIKKEKFRYDFTKNEKHQMHIKAALELIKKDFYPEEKLFKELDDFNLEFDFKGAKNFLRNRKYYKRIRPKTLKNVVSRIKEKFDKEYENTENITE